MATKDFSSSLQKLRKFSKSSQDDQKEARDTFKSFQIQLIRCGHKLKTEQDLKFAMEGLEIGAKIAINIRDIELFEKVMIQLKQYYLMGPLAECSKQREYLMGLYLMLLLTKNRLGDFHVELELLSFADLENKFIKFPNQIEESMMEGSYNKIIEARNSIPDQTYQLFLSNLETTVRNEIAQSLQSVHENIPLKDALQMLTLKSANDLNNYIKTEKLTWTVNGSNLEFAPREQKKQEINAVVTANDMLEFTSNIETIV